MSLTLACRKLLQGHLQAMAAGHHAIRPPKELQRAVAQVRDRYGQGQARLVTQDRVEAAVVAVSKGMEPTRRQLFVLAHALAQPVKALRGQSTLDVALGSQLLNRWEHVAGQRQLTPSHWRGLFRSYMQAAPGESCERLRRLLSGSIGQLDSKSGRTPSWLSGIRRHQCLLGNAPSAPYVGELLEGTSALLDDLSAEVDLPPGSWFWASLREAVVSQIAGMSESRFKDRLGYLLSLPNRIPGASDPVLIAALNRFATCGDRGRHLPLMEYALEAWGSPQLKSNQRWAFVSNDARQMVCGWLAQEDLEDFYQLCKGNQQVDDRRLRFWLRFKEQMGYTQILLGGYLRSSRDSDIRAFIAKKRGRVGDLTSGPASNNAILMQIGGWLFIEFSETGNACFAFPVADGAIDIGRKSYSLNQLKPGSGRRLIHMDGHETWEQKFEASLRQIGVRPDEGTAPTPRRAAKVQGPPSQDLAAERLIAKLKTLDVWIVDNRPKGGVIWAYPIGHPAPARELRALGMKYKADKAGYYWP